MARIRLFECGSMDIERKRKKTEGKHGDAHSWRRKQGPEGIELDLEDLEFCFS